MKVLVTGAAGYIGSTLLEYLLNAGHEVRAVDNFMYHNSYALATYLHNPKCKLFECDLRNIAGKRGIWDFLMNGVDVVIPLAAYVGAGICDRYPKDAEVVNTTQIYDIASRLEPNQKLIYPNTNSGYGVKDGVCTEEDELNPISVYGITKKNGEEIALEHPNTVVLRLATVFGPSPRMRFDLMVNNFFYKLSRDNEITLFEPQFRRNFVHVRDVARAFMFALDKNVRGVFNLGNDDLNCTKMELAEGIANYLCLVDAVKIGDGKDPDQRDYNVSSQKIRDAGFSTKYDFDNSFDELDDYCMGLTDEQFRAWGNHV